MITNSKDETISNTSVITKKDFRRVFLRSCTLDSAWTVSYTHLDVYKRQM